MPAEQGRPEFWRFFSPHFLPLQLLGCSCCDEGKFSGWHTRFQNESSPKHVESQKAYETYHQASVQREIVALPLLFSTSHGRSLQDILLSHRIGFSMFSRNKIQKSWQCSLTITARGGGSWLFPVFDYSQKQLPHHSVCALVRVVGWFVPSYVLLKKTV